MVQKQPTTRPKDSSAASDQDGPVGRHKLNPIKPPEAPAVIHSEEIGAPVAQDQAIREKTRLYPQASVKEIVAMFELEGLKVSPVAVKKIKSGKNR